MYSFADLHALQPVLDQLCEQKLVEPLTPSGRGQLFAHTLSESREAVSLRRGFRKTAGGGPKDYYIASDRESGCRREVSR